MLGENHGNMDLWYLKSLKDNTNYG